MYACARTRYLMTFKEKSVKETEAPDRWRVNWGSRGVSHVVHTHVFKMGVISAPSFW